MSRFGRARYVKECLKGLLHTTRLVQRESRRLRGRLYKFTTARENNRNDERERERNGAKEQETGEKERLGDKGTARRMGGAEGEQGEIQNTPECSRLYSEARQEVGVRWNSAKVEADRRWKSPIMITSFRL